MDVKKYKLLFANNFQYTGVREIDELEMSMLADQGELLFDERLSIMSVNNTLSNIDWIINYLKTASMFAKSNPSAYATYLLDLGYVPVVYLPSCCSAASHNIIGLMNRVGLQYINVKATSFTQSYFVSDMYDAWVHKLDAAKFLGIDPIDVTSEKIIRRLYENN